MKTTMQERDGKPWVTEARAELASADFDEPALIVATAGRPEAMAEWIARMKEDREGRSTLRAYLKSLDLGVLHDACYPHMTMVYTDEAARAVRARAYGFVYVVLMREWAMRGLLDAATVERFALVEERPSRLGRYPAPWYLPEHYPDLARRFDDALDASA